MRRVAKLFWAQHLKSLRRGCQRRGADLKLKQGLRRAVRICMLKSAMFFAWSSLFLPMLASALRSWFCGLSKPCIYLQCTIVCSFQKNVHQSLEGLQKVSKMHARGNKIRGDKWSAKHSTIWLRFVRLLTGCYIMAYKCGDTLRMFK